MDQENKAEVSGQTAKPKKRNILNWCLVLGIIAVAIVSIGFYVSWLGKSEPSDDPSDWAHFATYLSGTVGVAAVVATLFAFVKTLGQQQALIDSQNEMLKKQKEQLCYAENKDELSRAYEASINIFPHLAEAIKTKSDARFPFNVALVRENDRLYATYFNSDYYLGCIESADTFRIQLLLKNDSRIVNKELIVVFMENFFYEVYLAYGFMFQQLEVDGRLFYLFVSHMKKRVSKNIDVYSIMKCAYAFKKGLGEKVFCQTVERLLHMDEDFSKHENAWFELGRMVGKIDEEYRLTSGSEN
ncbi:hypothetical protein SAMN04487867_10862 [Vreelandella titanicae]|uniref:hypothetical protein n=1 Tax=Vreelandella titanicae TaxID=664683 RepID=UPI0008850F45|nr:hypothetical protein [Halomonas titanicae]SDI51935.1 hypothetical protein SAMN04487867_10862 [Halomonas titanicae]